MLWAILLLFVPSASLALIDCPNLNITLNSTKTWTFGPEQFASDKECAIVLHYDNSTFAQVKIDLSNAEVADVIELSNAYGAVPISVNNGKRNFLFSVSIPPPLLSIRIKTSANSTLNMNITVFGASFNPFAIRGDQQIVKADNYEGYWALTNLTEGFYYAAISYTKNAAIFITMPNNVADSYLLSNAFVYDGYIQAPIQLIGTLYDFLSTGYIYSQETQTITIYCADSLSPLEGVVMYTDKSNVDYFSSYNVLWAQKTVDPFQSFQLDATLGTAAVTIVNSMSGYGSIYLTDVTLSDPNATQVDAYNHGPLANMSNMVMLEALKNPNLNLRLPQHFDGSARTFVLKNGKATLKWTANATQTTDSVATIGRFGFIATPNYPLTSAQTSSQGITLHSANGQNYSLIIIIMDGSTNSKVIVDRLAPNQQSFTIPLNALTLKNSFNFVGTDFHVTITGGTSDSGTLVYFEISDDISIPTKLPPTVPSSTMSSLPNGTTSTKAASNYSIIPSFLSFLVILFR